MTQKFNLIKLATRFVAITLFILILIGIIAAARGYRLDFQKQSLTSTGIIAVSAFPKAASVYIDGTLKGVTDLNLTLPPGEYMVEVKKEGYTSWTKKVKLKGELVLTLDVLLYPLNPALSPMTNLGITNAIPISQFDKVLLFSESGDSTKDGIYLYEGSKSPLSFFPPLRLIILKAQLVNSAGELDFKDVEVHVSPDAKEAIFSFQSSDSKPSYLLSLEEENTSVFDISGSKDTLLTAWKAQRDDINKKIFEAYPKEIAKIASDSFDVVEFSADESKVLYLAKNNAILPIAINPPLIATNQTPEVRSLVSGQLYVYDKKEDKNFAISNQISSFQVPTSNLVSWYSDSKHLAINEGKKITFIDYDGSNRQTVYSGPYSDFFMKITADGKVLFLTNLNPEANKFSDLYAVVLK